MYVFKGSEVNQLIDSSFETNYRNIKFCTTELKARLKRHCKSKKYLLIFFEKKMFFCFAQNGQRITEN